jgi:predicted DsbA family dithiol-disulfide isomerase
MEKATSELNLPLEFGILRYSTRLMLELQFEPFELNKSLPDEGISKRKLYTDKYGSDEQANAAEEYMKKLGQT